MRRNFLRSGKSKQNRSRTTLSIEKLDDRIVMTASPYDVVTYDFNTGVETITPFEAGPIESGLAEGGQAGFDPKVAIPATFPDGHTPNTAQESVFGSDDRVLIDSPNVGEYRRTGAIRMLKTDGDWSFCSGALVGPSHFLTAGHCVHEGGTGASGWYTNIEVALGRDGDERWFGVANATNVTSVVGWTQNDDWEYDWAIIELDRNIGNQTGWNGYWWYGNDNTYDGMDVTIAGYPGDIATQWSQATLSTDTHQIEMYESSGEMLSPTSHQLRYNDTLDTAGGMSGSAVVEHHPTNGNLTVGVHAYGDGGNGRNEATRLREPITDIISDIRNNAAPTDRADLTDWDSWFDTDLSFMNRDTVSANEQLTVQTYPRNNGTAPTGNYTVSFYASSNTIISGFDYFLGSESMGSLDPISWDTANIDITFPEDVPAGDYYVGWVIDSGDTVTEYLEGNNTGYIDDQLTVTVPVDDHGDFAAAATLIQADQTLGGNLELTTDTDWFYFDAAEGAEIDLGTTLGTLADSTIGIYDSDGNTLLAFDDDSGAGLSSQLDWVAPAQGRYYVEVESFADAYFGTYDVNLTHVDDHSDFIFFSTPVAVNSSQSGVLEVGGDQDVFWFESSPGTSYNIETQLGSLGNSRLELYEGFSLVESDNNSGPGLASQISWTATDEAFYYVAASGIGNSVGSFDVSVTAYNADSDFDGDHDNDCDDVDALVAAIVDGGNDATYDLDSDGLVDTDDLTLWLQLAGEAAHGAAYLPGDANLDGVVDTSDFNIWNSNKFTAGGGWCRADFNADGVTDTGDFNVWNSNKFSAPVLAAAPFGDPLENDPNQAAIRDLTGDFASDLEAGDSSEFDPSQLATGIPAFVGQSVRSDDSELSSNEADKEESLAARDRAFAIFLVDELV